jgi:protein-disulfide isomerase
MRIVLILTFMLCVFFNSVFKQASAAESFSANQTKAIETIVHDYIVKNPDVLREAFFALEKQEKDRLQVSQKKALEDYSKLLTESDKQGVIGNPKGDVTLVLFFDYNCGYCKAAEPDIERLIKEDPKLRVVLKEFPILGSSSIEAALISAQLIKDPKYGEFHHVLISMKGEIDKSRALEVAKSLGLNTEKLDKGSKSEAARTVVEESYKLANALTINGTPGYVIGHDVFAGATSYENLKSSIDNVRRCGKASC